MSQPVTVGGLTFANKTKAKRYVGDIRHTYTDGVRVAPEDDSLLREVLHGHPEAEEKIGAGVAYFTVETDTYFRRTRHFVVHRVDGTASDFSFPSCFDGPNERRDRLQALRRAVEDQIIDFRDQSFLVADTLTCPLRGIPVTRDSYHVDHAAPRAFATLVQCWLNAIGLTMAQVEITPPADNQLVAAMTNPAQRISWCGFHRREAKLRLLSPRGNLSNARRGQ